jgi:DUF1365 family protein
MSWVSSGLYLGSVTHLRVKPRRHRFRYRLFMALFDLDEMDQLDRGLTLFSHNRANVFSFFDRDHLSGDGEPLRAQVERLLQRAGLPCDGGAIRLLCMPRMFGYAFNPISVYFCHRRDGALMATLYEVNNTFGQRHAYLIGAPASDGWITQQCVKQLHVSPFMDMDLTYTFHIRAPRADIAFNVNAHKAGSLVLATGFLGRRAEFGDRMLSKLIFAFPLLTFKVILAIHFEALRLLLKGVRLRPSPPTPAAAATIIPVSKE